MGDFWKKSLREIMELSASSSPVPGGGSVSAIVACLGATMTAMVCNLTVGKEKYRGVEPLVLEINNSVGSLMTRLEDLMEKDMAEFENFMAVYRLPKKTEEEINAREEAMQKALKGSTEIPMEIARSCHQILELTHRLSGIGNKMVISDAGVAAIVTEAALNSVLLTAQSNMPLITDTCYTENTSREITTLVTGAGQLKEKILSVVRERMK
ncbi:MAG: Methenyltetrahydrofolate cyclohydrolase [Firmicutes bacterium ADurb.Bin456]|nr:MAG: Methenyltetrahydrofolate cyclohydrolase [Firmicutes bacterium ADurb.Bin456]